jgi:flagellar basal body-associated protein FliL
VQTEEQKKKKRKKVLKIVGAVVGVLLLVSCCGIGGLAFLDSEPTATPAPATKLVITVVASSTPTAVPTLTLQSTTTSTPQPTAIPTPQPTLTPIPVPVVFEGSGDVVTDNIRLSACQKSVFSWRHGGTSNFFVDLCGGSCRSLIIAGRDDTTGEAFQPLTGGGYYLVVESGTGPWTVTWECRD